jgi:hypothetical protein
MAGYDPSSLMNRTQRSLLRAARAALSAGFAVISGDLAAMLAPGQAWWLWGVTAGTMIFVYWWTWGRIFKNVGLVAK